MIDFIAVAFCQRCLWTKTTIQLSGGQSTNQMAIVTLACLHWLLCSNVLFENKDGMEASRQLDIQIPISLPSMPFVMSQGSALANCCQVWSNGLVSVFPLQNHRKPTNILFGGNPLYNKSFLFKAFIYLRKIILPSTEKNIWKGDNLQT